MVLNNKMVFYKQSKLIKALTFMMGTDFLKTQYGIFFTIKPTHKQKTDVHFFQTGLF